MLYSGTDPESYIIEYTLAYEDKSSVLEAPSNPREDSVLYIVARFNIAFDFLFTWEPP